ncbi:hypothetical protein Tdes44962_MAKER09796 [Teratosphaeria destructans]|uniref:Uncharacterized protein n=1 Tax=Teratosphaeria destructans TaxID=418781 RepID=A0A9W7SR99_9PEZI|nr:hypothetical protein Tdes44962_MAKER09796 [Teratosphaeria destructans]
MTAALARSEHVQQTFTAAVVNHAYRHLDRDSVMIKFLVRHAAEHIDGASMPASAAPFWSEHLGDVIRRLLEHRRGRAPPQTSPCTDHDHPDGRRSDGSCARSLEDQPPDDQPPTPDMDLMYVS